MNLICKYYKLNKNKKCLFIVSPDDDEDTHKLIEQKYNLIDESFQFNPIFRYQKGGKNIYYLTCIYNNGYNLEPHTLYKMKVEIRKYDEKYINIFVCGTPKKMNKQNYDLL